MHQQFQQTKNIHFVKIPIFNKTEEKPCKKKCIKRHHLKFDPQLTFPLDILKSFAALFSLQNIYLRGMLIDENLKNCVKIRQNITFSINDG